VPNARAGVSGSRLKPAETTDRGQDAILIVGILEGVVVIR
jgi:hypothetical protein